MSIRILTKNGEYTSNIEGARFNYFNTAHKDGFLSGVLNEGNIFLSSSNVIGINTGELLIGGHRIVMDSIEYIKLANAPESDSQKSLIGQIVIDEYSLPSFSVFAQDASISLIKNSIYNSNSGQGTYQVKLATFTHKTNNTITNLVASLGTINSNEVYRFYTSIDDLGLNVPTTMSQIVNSIFQQNISNSCFIFDSSTNIITDSVGGIIQINVGEDPTNMGILTYGNSNYFVGEIQFEISPYSPYNIVSLSFARWRKIMFSDLSPYKKAFNSLESLNFADSSIPTTTDIVCNQILTTRTFDNDQVNANIKVLLSNINNDTLTDTPEATGLLEIITGSRERDMSIKYTTLTDTYIGYPTIIVSGVYYRVTAVTWKRVVTEAVT